ncbi:O-succinylbenzoate synthase [Amycolatopsis bartoniae]|uniref:o-succinylbenzoate synthase n=1 Tax=Amycolatopsis bartoniae TaxID=941986 RepID=A0A8H9IYP8_9PSEU|nr:o-succinylbenzoate synthase [Amycolatopsis bartoniae]MBB2938678.1 O-succinylbenzoate synthase [Amycolatopsis bartoniae]TVT11534.1 o-succinylbenzoate synthase [Amycolatopsis bartoniae]GHF79358.1 o-succinylbenzoate synthase [Amycolatopsis bartoniae]
MKLDGIEIVRASISLRDPIRTSFGSLARRDLVLVRAVTPDADGWGECVAPTDPLYSSEYADAAATVLERFLAPRLLERGEVTAETVAEVLHPIRGHRMAKAAIEAAVLDAQLRSWGVSFADYLGATRDRVPAGVSIGIRQSVGELVDVVAGFLNEGYRRIKIKIAPGWDVEPVRALRAEFGDDLPLQVDANCAYTLADAEHLARLDEFGLQLLEQPLGEEQMRQHAELARLVRTPIALDETILSAESAADAVGLKACRIVNIKPGRVGGYLEGRRIHDLCRANGIAVWCGGMAETGLGRAGNVALAALPGFMPGDNSASDRYFEQDLTEPFLLEDGHLKVPTGPGFGVAPRREVLKRIIDTTAWIAA